jgi:hypothetical protein
MSNEIPTKEIGELLDSVSTKVPLLITNLLDTIYSPEAGKKMGQAVGSLYKELVDSGIPAEDALAMAKEYMISMKSMLSAVNVNQNQ